MKEVRFKLDDKNLVLFLFNIDLEEEDLKKEIGVYFIYFSKNKDLLLPFHPFSQFICLN